MNGYNFTDNVRLALQMAREQAATLGHEYVGTEHILLAIALIPECGGARMLSSFGVSLAELRNGVVHVIKHGDSHRGAGVDLPYTSRAKKVLEFAMMAARDAGHGFVGTQHLLAGLAIEQKGIAGHVLDSFGVDAARVTEALSSADRDERVTPPLQPREIPDADVRGSTTLTTAIRRNPVDVYRFVADPRNLPRWATGFARQVELLDGVWRVDSPLGPVTIRFAPDNSYGVLDHWVTDAHGREAYAPMRVIPNRRGCEVMFTAFRVPGSTDHDHATDVQTVRRDLATLKRLMEQE